VAVSVANTWTSSFSILAGYAYTHPVGQGMIAPVGNTAGNWLVALVSWQAPGDSPATMAVGDDAGNHWIPLGAPVGTSSAAGNVRSAIWAAPYAAAAGNVWAAPSGQSPAQAMIVLEVAGMAPGMSLQGIGTGWGNSAASVTVPLPAPAQQALVLACCGTDDNAFTVTMSGSGWTALTPVVTSDGADHLADLTLTAGWQVATGATSATWTASGSLDLGACTAAVAVMQAAPAGPSQGWPKVQFEVAFGAGIATPWDQLTWTDLTSRYRGLSGTRGKQYELDSVQAGSLPVTLSNNDGALTPGYAGSPYNLGISGWTAQNGAAIALSRYYAQSGPTSMLMAPDGVTGSPYANTGQFPVTAGTTCSGRAAVLCPSGWGAGVLLTIDWYDSGHGYLSSSNGPIVVPASGQWTFPEIARTAPAGAAFARLDVKVNGTPPSTALFWWDACYLTGPAGQVLNPNPVFSVGPDVYTPARRKATWMGRTYVDWRGFIERWPSQLSASRYTTAGATATDVLAGLTSLLPTVAAGEILNDDPWGYWPCSDAAGSAMAANLAPGGAGPLNVAESKFGPGPTGTYAFGGSTALPGAPSGCWTQSGLNSGSTDVQHGYCLQLAAAGSSPPISAGITVEAWHNFGTGSTVQPNGKLIVWSLQGPYGPIAQLYGDYDGSGAGLGWYLSVTDKGTRAVTAYRVAAFGIETFGGYGGWVHFAVTLTQTAWRVWIDGGGFTATIPSGTCNLAASFQWVTFGGSADRVSTGGMSNLSLAGLAVYPRVLPQTRIVAHVLGAGTGLPGDVAGRRIGRLLSYATGMLVPRRLATGSDNLQPATDISGTAVAQSVTNIAQSDSGLLFVDRCGYLAFDSRASRWNRAVAWNIGEQAGAILNANWDFESGIAPWVPGSSATVAPSSALSFTGTSSMLVTPSAGGASGAVSELVAVTTGTTYTATAWLCSPGGYAAGGVAQVQWLTSAHAFISTTTGTVVPLNAGQWTNVTASAAAPAGAAYAKLVVAQAGSPAPANQYYADQAQLVLPGEIPYLADVAPGFDPSQVFNDLTITQYLGLAVAAASASSMAQYGDLTLQETVYLSDSDVVTDLTNWILATYGQPATRVTFTVDAAANPYAWQFVLSADVGTVVQASRRLQGTQAVIQAQFVIQSVAPANAPGQWQVKYVASPYYLGALATNDPVRGLPNGLNPIALLRRR
jgi:hypothetical protein